MSNQIVPAHELVLNQESLFKTALSTDIVKWEKESQFAIQQLQKNEYLHKTANKNLASLQNAIINVAAIGISLNPANKHAYLVPRDGMVCLDVSYMGLMHLAVKSGSIEWGQAKLVYENDQYENQGIDKPPIHKQQTFKDKGPIIGVYCTVKLKSGDYLTEEMDMAAIEKVKSSSKANNGPWKTFPEEMIRKTVVKRASKYWPSCESVSEAINVINEHEGLSEEHITAPEINSANPDQKEYFDQLISRNDKIGMFLFTSSLDEGVYTNLYHSFPKGEKGKYQKIVDKLNAEGREELLSYYVAFGDAAGDDLATAELLFDLSDDALDFVTSKLDVETASYVQKVKREMPDE